MFFFYIKKEYIKHSPGTKEGLGRPQRGEDIFDQDLKEEEEFVWQAVVNMGKWGRLPERGSSLCKVFDSMGFRIPDESQCSYFKAVVL